MLTQIAEGVLTHQSSFMQTNAVVVLGNNGVLLVDAGVTGDEMRCLADDLSAASHTVAAGFSTHPHWDHLLWLDVFGDAPRYATQACAATAKQRLSDAGAKARVASMMPPGLVEQVPLDLLGKVNGLPDGSDNIPWDGPSVRVVKHRAHAPGHAALLVESPRVLIAGDLLSDILIPMLDVMSSEDPVGDYLEALLIVEAAAANVETFVPGHGSPGGPADFQARIEQDRAYLNALRESAAFDDPRLGPGTYGEDFLPAVHEGQATRLAERGAAETATR